MWDIYRIDYRQAEPGQWDEKKVDGPYRTRESADSVAARLNSEMQNSRLYTGNTEYVVQRHIPSGYTWEGERIY